MSETIPVGARRHGAMRLLSPAQRRLWQDETLHSPRHRYGIPAWLLFRLEDVVFGPGRSVPKFRALEIINRVAYQAWEQAAYYLAGKLRERSVRARQLHDTVEKDRTAQDNEKWHNCGCRADAPDRARPHAASSSATSRYGAWTGRPQSAVAGAVAQEGCTSPV